MNQIGANISNIRNKKGLSQSEVAEKIYVTPQCVSRWEQGKTEPDIDTIKKMCIIFDCSIEEIIGDVPTKNKVSDDKAKKMVHRCYIIASFVMLLLSIYIIFDLCFKITTYMFFVFMCCSLLYLIMIFVGEIYLHHDEKKSK